METEIVESPERKENLPQVATSVSLMQMALEKNYPLDQIEKMMELQDRFDAKEAKKAFIRAMADFKSRQITIFKTGFNNKYGSKYATLGDYLAGALPEMSKCGLSHRWEIDQTNGTMIKGTCIVTHQDGHSESTFMTAPPDKSGSKNPIQEIKSTITYLKSVTFDSLMGLAATDANVDDDGNGSHGQPVTYIDDKQKSQIFDMIAAIAEIDPSRTETNFINYMKVVSVDMIPANKFGQAMSALAVTLAAAKKEQEAKA